MKNNFMKKPEVNKVNKWLNYPENWQIMVMIITVIGFLIGLTIFVSVTFFKEIHIKGRVISHAVTETRYGDTKYHTIAQFEDGRIRDLEGLNNYIKPVGANIIYTDYVLK